MTDQCLNVRLEVTEEEVKFRNEKFANVEDVLKQNLKCTVCSTDLSGQISVRHSCRRHVVLQVLVCKKCKEFYGDGDLSTEEDGGPKYCRWCGDGGDLFLCDRCDSGFCKPCVRRNFSRSYSRKLGKAKSWTCFVCAPEVLYDLRARAWAARELCKQRIKKEKEKGERRGKRCTNRKDHSSLEASFASHNEGSPLKLRINVEGNSSKECANPPPSPTDTADVKTERRENVYKNPVLEQSKLELKGYLSQLANLQYSELFRQIETDLADEKDCDSFAGIEQLELMMQDYIIRLIDDLNRVSTDLSSRVAQLQRLYVIAEDEAREKGGFDGDCTQPNDDLFESDAFGGDCTRPNDHLLENDPERDEIDENSDQDDVISLSSRLSDDSVFSSVSTSRNNGENRCENGENLRENGSDTTTGFSLANMAATSTPSKEIKVEKHIKMEVESPRIQVEGEGDGSEREGEEEKNDDNINKTMSQDEYVLKLLGDDSDSGGEGEGEDEEGEGEDEEGEEEETTEIGLGEESVESDEEEEGLDLRLGEESVESDDEEGEEGMGERIGVESEESEEEEEEEQHQTVVERKSVEGEEIPILKKIEERETEEDGRDDENKENEDVNSLEMDRGREADEEIEKGIRRREADEEIEKGIRRIEADEEIEKGIRRREADEEIEKGIRRMEADEEIEKGVRRIEADEEIEKRIEKLRNSKSLNVKDCHDPTDEKKIESSDNETDFSQNDMDKTTIVEENCNSGANSDASTDFELGDNEAAAATEEKMNVSIESEKGDGEANGENEKETESRSGDDWDWEEINRLANLGALDRHRRKRNFSTTSEDSGSDKSQKRSPKKKAKKNEEKYKSQEEDSDFFYNGCEDAFEIGHKSFQSSRTSPAFDCNSIFRDSDDNSAGKNSESDEEMKDDKKAKEKSVEDEKDTEKKTDKEEKNTDSVDSAETVKLSPKKRPSWKRDELLTGKLSSTDEDDKKAAADRRRERREKKKRMKRARLFFRSSVSEGEDLTDGGGSTDNDDDDDDDDCNMLSNSGSDSSIQFVMSKSKRSRVSSSSGSIHSISSINDNDGLSRTRKKKTKIWPRKKRTKISLLDDSSENGSSCEEVDNYMNTSSQSQSLSGQGRRNIRKVMKDEDVALATKKAIREEEERKQRVSDRQQKFNDSFGISDGSAPIVENRLVLDFDTKTKKELISVDENLVAQMKSHQVEGVKFMWDACFESLEAIRDGEGGGCILAHCMGLGKTFQVVSLVHTLLMNRSVTKVRRVLICCPLTTVLNWYCEFQKWMANLPLTKRVALHHLANDKTIKRRVSRLQSWHENGGVMIMGYEMFRSLTNEDKKVVHSNYKAVFAKTLLKPGADLVICDEGHTLKNLKTALSKQMNKIQTKRRIVLTGTPLQNNLLEYHCMMDFVKPNYLGTKTEFHNRFVNPITNGQFVNSTPHDVKVMKRRAHVLHKMLDGITQRRDYSVLKPYLPAKQEYVISIRLTELQTVLMKHFLEQVVVQKQLFKDYQSLSRLWSHPLTLRFSKSRKKRENDEKAGDIENAFNENSNDSDVQIVPNGVAATDNAADKKKDDEERREEGGGATENGDKEKEWWENLVSEEQMNDVTVSAKLVLLFEFLKQCVTIGDKVLIFSQKLAMLDVIEYFLEKLDKCSASDKENVLGSRTWKKGADYFRLDGSTAGDLREKWIKAFNNPTNRSRLFLISTRAGGMGINLTAANRVILFDVSWNPSHDIQSIFRVFRFGQDKPCYVYRFIAQGTMEEKIYERQISKLSLSSRVVDEQQVNRYYTQSDLQELYKFTPAGPDDRPVLMVPKDRVLCEMLEEHSALIYKVFEHDSLLNHVQEEELDEEEQRAAWEDYKNEKKKALNIDRIQSSTVQSIPTEDIEMLLSMTIPEQDVELMERMLMRKYGATISPEKLKEILNKEVELWKRNRIAQLTGGVPASGPATNTTSRPTTSRSISSNTTYSTTSNAPFTSRPPTSSYTPSTSWATTSSNTNPTSGPRTHSAPSTSRPINSAPSTSRPMNTAPSTSKLPTSSDAPSTSRPISNASSTSRPISTAPSTSRPISTAPSTSRPISTAPSTSRPISTAPSTSRPTSSAPSTSRPTSSAPSTSMPTTSNNAILDNTESTYASYTQVRILTDPPSTSTPLLPTPVLNSTPTSSSTSSRPTSERTSSTSSSTFYLPTNRNES